MEAMNDLWKWLNESTVPVADATYLQVLIGLILLWVILRLSRRVFAKKKGKEYLIRVYCASCGWEGSISKFTKLCPHCHDDKVTLGGKRHPGGAGPARRSR